MRNLIKKLLKEYFNPEIKIEIVGWCSDELLEELKKNSRLISEQDREWYIDDSDTWRNYVGQIKTYIKDNFPVTGTFIDKKTGQPRTGTILEILVTDHYYHRLFRSKDPDYRPNGNYYNPKLIDPDPLEGVKLIHDHAGQILMAIMTTDPNKRRGLKLIISKNNKPIYTIVVEVVTPSIGGKTQVFFNLVLITQLKGDSLRDDRKYTNNKKVKLNNR
jgi:hypothetical protein